MCFAAEYPTSGPVSRQGSWISTQVAAVDKPSVPSTTFTPQLHTLVDAESIVPKQAAEMAEEAGNSTTYLHLADSSLSPKHTVLQTVTKFNEAILEADMHYSQDETCKVRDVRKW